MLIVPVLAGIKFSKPKAKEKVEDDFSAEFRPKVSTPASNTPFVEDFGSDGSHDDFKIPLSKAKRNSLARDLFYQVQSYADAVNKTRSVSEFFSNYDKLISTLRKAEKLDGKATNLKGNFFLDRIRIESEFQKHIHGLLDRSSKEIVSEYKGVYKYDKGYIERRIQTFKTECDLNLSRMDTANQGYANALFLYLCNECKAIELLDDPEEEATPGRPVSTITDFGDYELLKIDTMEGHDFEYWTADLLRTSGFYNVEVTRGSGDQGVDVLAQKDGIKYAIQCKCYSSNLGNTPIQEVNAGKMFYHCQVAAVITNQYFTQGAKELAEATGVLLWDRDWIHKMVEKNDK